MDRAWTARSQTAAAWLGAGAAFCFSFFGLEHVNVVRGLPFVPHDLLLGLGAPLFSFSMWQHRASLRRSPVFWAVLALSASQLLAAATSARPAEELRTAARMALAITTVGGLGCLAAQERFKQLLLRAFVTGGAVALIVSLVGFAAMLVHGGLKEGVNPFVFVSANPVFHGWPRLSGTFGHSPEFLGEYLSALLTVALILWARSGKRIIKALLAATCLGLLLTFSLAWTVGVVVLFGGFAVVSAPGSWRRPAAVALIGLAAIVSTARVNIGQQAPLPAETLAAGLPCLAYDHWHHASGYTDPSTETCRPLIAAWPKGTLTSTYLYSKLVALDVARSAPFWGVGFRQYGDRAAALFRADFGVPFGVHYDSPHCEYLGAWAVAGIPGVISLLAFVIVIARWGRNVHGLEASERLAVAAPWLALIGYLLLGVNLDVLQWRHVWFLQALLVAHEIHFPWRFER